MKILTLALVLITISIETHAYSKFDTVNVFYVYHKDGSDIGYQKWTGMIQEYENTQETMKNLLMDQHRLDRVKVGKVNPGYCGVLYSDQHQNGKIEYLLNNYLKNMDDAKKYAKEKFEATYGDYKILEVICTPKDPKGVKIVKEGTVSCPDGTDQSYKIRKVTGNTKSFLIVQSRFSNIRIDKGQRLDQNKLAKAVCGADATRDDSFIMSFAFEMVRFLNELAITDCMEEKSKSREACKKEMVIKKRLNSIKPSGGYR